MSVTLNVLVQYCNELLKSNNFKDYCPNGLQVEGKPAVKKIVSGVTACQALLDKAALMNADLVLVHHGYFWKGEQDNIVSIKKKRIKTLLDNDMSLLAYHLPLDAHATLGNNIQLANKMNWTITSGVSGEVGQSIALLGELKTAIPAQALAEQLANTLEREPLHLAGHDRLIKRIAWCTGAAQSYLEEAAQHNIDAFISGEVSEQTTHLVRELGVDYFSAGHHATERYGVQALGEHLAAEFQLEHHFVDIDNPV